MFCEAAPLELFDGALTDGRELLPHFYDYPLHGGNENNDERLCECDEVAFLTEHMSPDYFLVIGIPLDDPAKGIGSEVILGKCAHVYATEENLYVTTRHNEDNDSTAVYKFWFDGETIVYGSNADVAGEVFNQFSMDESDDHLRIATTSDTELKQNIYIFDSGMKETGSLEDFTSGDNIRSIRFVDERCYVVIDRNILPLSVISLTDPKDPFILDVFDIFHGIEYIHPYAENLILGFGRETVDTTEMGMKISFYDFSDMANPEQICLDEIIGDGGTESEVFTDHRALLFSKEANLMAFPVTVKEDDGMPQYTFQGAYIYQIDDSGFDRRFEITHYPLGTFPIGSDYDYSGDHIRRIVSMGDYDYTISDSRITAILTPTDMFSLLLE